MSLGIVFDFACGFNLFLLNWEPREWEFLRTWVDGSHWNGHKKLKKGYGLLYFVKFYHSYMRFNRGKSSPGHLGCSRGFNSQLYKAYLPATFNTQGREQVLQYTLFMSFSNYTFRFILDLKD